MEDFKEEDMKSRKGGEEERGREWLGRDRRNPRNVFSPEASVTNSRREP